MYYSFWKIYRFTRIARFLVFFFPITVAGAELELAQVFVCVTSLGKRLRFKLGSLSACLDFPPSFSISALHVDSFRPGR